MHGASGVDLKKHIQIILIEQNLLALRKSIEGKTFILTWSSVLFYHRGVYTRLVPFWGSKYAAKVKLNLNATNIKIRMGHVIFGCKPHMKLQ